VQDERLAAVAAEFPALDQLRQTPPELLVDDARALAAQRSGDGHGECVGVRLPWEGDLDRHKTHGAAMLSTVAA
jgi:hypothetical protein